MTKLIAIILMIFTAILHVLFGSPRVYAGQISSSVTTRDGRSPADCGAIDVTFDDQPAARASESFTIPTGDADALRAVLPSGSGVRVTGWDRDEYAVTVCKAARDGATLSRVAVAHQGGDLTPSGPSGDAWLVYLLVRAPRGASLDFEARNGSIDVKGVSGKIRARTRNGPVSLSGCDAEIVATTENGPISFSGRGRNVDLRANNGPVSVRLEGSSWEGGRLTARTRNGPLSLSLESGFRSGVDVRSTGNSPFSCSAEACAGADRTWDEGQRGVHFGDRQSVVSVSTENGPVSIQTPKNDI